MTLTEAAFKHSERPRSEKKELFSQESVFNRDDYILINDHLYTTFDHDTKVFSNSMVIYRDVRKIWVGFYDSNFNMVLYFSKNYKYG